MVKLKSCFRKFYGRHHELVDRYEITVSHADDIGYVPHVVTIQYPFLFTNLTYRIRLLTGFVQLFRVNVISRTLRSWYKVSKLYLLLPHFSQILHPHLWILIYGFKELLQAKLTKWYTRHTLSNYNIFYE